MFKYFVRLLVVAVSLSVFWSMTASVTFANRTYKPITESLSKHEVPDWFLDAKLGIFVHWGVYSVPGWAPLTGEFSKVVAERGWEYWFLHNSYAEWYYNSMKLEGGDTYNYHRATYGENFTYEDFIPRFNAAITNWNPQKWAKLFSRVGARYVVLTTKHHDGFLLWPSKTASQPGRVAARDIVGELTQAVRQEGMRMGLYYSGGIDWSKQDTIVTDFNTLLAAINQDKAYAEYANAHWRELIDRYQPSILWNDLGYPAGEANKIIAYFYNHVPDGVVNDRFDLGGQFGLHYDFSTPEYSQLQQIEPKKWEATRGLGYSFGYNQNDTDLNMISVDELVDLFVDVVSKNGNLLLNVGPSADGSISKPQVERLLGLGKWLDINGEAIFGSRYWIRSEDVTSEGLQVRYTTNKGNLYAVLLDTPTSRRITIQGLVLPRNTTITMLGVRCQLRWEQYGQNLFITLPDMSRLKKSPAYTLRISNIPDAL
ncbi:FUCA, alpha-L-fucosidase (plasmid) [Nostoc flagelliforme CCNUN1]|uniref:alpha-L-fucosidase n=1 Tax=Nostoc flagelliforme CCNUN1 TaxID=2038116 RepID=A0A2K8T9M3_9NOSO|nr:alpha-L-fucosidase [Nostoc flagelliforme]AUB44394.1 FUCA, alpha-L-fucosidase [Nostoc flagelliforme CCNUN1]